MEKPICKTITANREPFSCTFGTNGGQQLHEAQLVGRMLLQRLATGTTGVKQVRYKQLPTDYPYVGATRNMYYTCMRSILTYVSIVYDVLQFVCIEFRRGFCTLVLFIVVINQFPCRGLMRDAFRSIFTLSRLAPWLQFTGA